MNARTRLSAVAEAVRASGPPVEVVGASGGFAAFVLAALRRELARPLVIVVPDAKRAEEIADGLHFFEPTHGAFDPVARFRALDHTPFVGMSPSRVHVMDRVASLYRLSAGLGVTALVVEAAALLDRVIPRSALAGSSHLLNTGDLIDREAFLQSLAGSGYHAVPTVEDPGSFAIRGGLVDVYCPLYELPIRVDLWGDEIDTLRFFDPDTQTTVERVDAVHIAPARDVIFSDEAMLRAKHAILDLADELHVPSKRARAVTEDVGAGILGVGMEDLLPAFHAQLDTLFDAAPKEALWIVEEPERVLDVIEERWERLEARASEAREAGKLAYPAEALYLPADDATKRLGKAPLVRMVPFETAETSGSRSFRYDAQDNTDVRREIEAATAAGQDEVLAPLASRVHAWRSKGWPVVVCAHTEGGAVRLAGLLAHYGLKVDRYQGDFDLDRAPEVAASDAQVGLFVGDPGQGFRSEELALVILDESEILGKKARRQRRRRRSTGDQALQSFRDLAEGDYVVHLQHGIGKYLGLTKTAVDAIEADFLVLQYADKNKLFVPVDKLHLVSKYVASPDAKPSVDKLGGTRWERRSTRAKKAARQIADKLLKIYAEREARRGHSFDPPGDYFARFEADFPYEETPDQAQAIEEVLADMQREQPMDRLICGDVGFGKTEVAMRAAFLAILSGKQAAVLVPTRVLAEQHKLTFERRMSGFPVTVEVLTRSLSSREQRELIKRLESGHVDIVVGTHRLLSKDVGFKDLGLLVVDEEHRFGVAHKERIREYKAEVDVLTLTATPIPRTLHMALVGMRDISLIQTPPADRLAVRTLVAQPTEDVIAEAIESELARGGQVFYVHNRVEDIAKHAELLSRLVPTARIIVGHGQMSRGQLQDVMASFVRGDHNVLVATTIIESGIDIPNANTMLINRADRFGLAQLYQLRGRVGRSSERAYCYLLIPSPKNLVGDAKSRIAAIQRFTELGSGFSIASYDLDIRGAGDLLGADQSGHIDAVGYDAFIEMVQEAVEDLKARAELPEGAEPEPRRPEPEVSISMEARIPESWLPDTTLRLRLYRDLAAATSREAVLTVFQEAVDRFGKPPRPVKTLVDVMVIKLWAKELGLSSVGFNRKQLTLGLTPHTGLTGGTLAELLALPKNRYRLTEAFQLVRRVTAAEWEEGLPVLRESLRRLDNFVSNSRSRSVREDV